MEPTSIYDAPGILFEQLFDGELTARSAKNTVMNPEALSPKERDSIADRLKVAMGDSGVGRAMAGIVANPWVWLFFLTTPAASRGGHTLFDVAKQYAPAVRTRTPALASLGMMTNAQVVRGSEVADTAFAIERQMRKVLSAPSLNKFQDSVRNVFGKAGLDPEIAWRDYAVGDPRREVAKRLTVSLQAAMEQWHKGSAGRVRPVYNKASKSLELVEEAPPIAGRIADPMTVLKEFDGGEQLVKDIRAALDERANYMTEDGVKGMLRMIAGARLQSVGGHVSHEVAGGKLVARLQGMIERAEKITDPVKRAARFKEIEGHADTILLQPYMKNRHAYLPRNTTDTYINGVKQDRAVTLETNPIATLSARQAPRGQKPLLYHPDDLEAVAEVLGDSPELRKQIDDARSQMAARDARNQPYRVARIDPIAAVRRHMDSTSRDYAMFVAPLDEEVLLANRNKPRGKGGVPGTHMSWRGGEDLNKTIDEVRNGAMAPLGGISNADVINQAWATSPDKHFRATVRDSIVPHIMGRLRPEYAVTRMAIEQSKRAMSALAESPIGSALANSGKTGASIVDQMKKYAATDTTLGDAGGVTRHLSRLLYASHLGVNASSAVINLSQPLLFAGSWAGYKHTLAAYGDAFKEMTGYIKERADEGFKVLSPSEKAARARRHFSFVTADEDMLGITDTAEELLEGMTFSATGHAGAKPNTETRIFELFMKGFEKTEHMNRLITAHTLKRARGFQNSVQATRSPQFRSELRQFVQETQYGSHWMNVPQRFLPKAKGSDLPGGGWTSNGLVRMFLSFPLRSMVAGTAVSSKLAGREGGERWTGLANDFLRGMAASAIMYEVGKATLGADLSRAGYASAVTDIVPGLSQGRYSAQEGPIPIPPVIDIPFKAMQGVLGDDADLLRTQISRVIPGGVALSRAMGIAPAVPLVGPLAQKSFANWQTRSPEGLVPLFKADGSLIGYEEPVSLVLKGLGMDFGAASDSKLAASLLQNREAANQIRSQAIAGMLNGNAAQVKRAQAEYQRKFGVPLSISKEQMRSAWRQRNVGRPERILDSLPRDIRDQFTRVVAQEQGARTGLDPARFEAAQTSRERTEAGRPQAFESFGGFE